MTTIKTSLQEGAERFADAILRGDRLFAHPDTIQQMRECPETKELAEKFEPSQYMERGQLFAISPMAFLPESYEIPIDAVAYPEAQIRLSRSTP